MKQKLRKKKKMKWNKQKTFKRVIDKYMKYFKVFFANVLSDLGSSEFLSD